MCAAVTARQTYRRANFNSLPDVYYVTEVSRVIQRDDGDEQQYQMTISLRKKESEWEITRVKLGPHRSLTNCYRVWDREKRWEEQFEFLGPRPTVTILLPWDCPRFFPVTLYIRRVSHYKERETLEVWCINNR